MLKLNTLALITSVLLSHSLFLYADVNTPNKTIVSFYTKDQHGSIAGATDADGNLTASTLNQYNDYGVNQNSNNDSGQISIRYDPYQYSGEYTDNESGLQPLGNGYRYYDPSLMRFISPDSYPLLNLYAYGSGNPIMEMDPTGHLSMTWQAGVGMAAAGISGAIAGFFTAGITDFVGLAVTEALLGATTSVLGDTVTKALGGKVSTTQELFDAGMGAAAGLVAPAVGGLTNNMSRSFITGGNGWIDSIETSWIKLRFGSASVDDLIVKTSEKINVSYDYETLTEIAKRINPLQGQNNCGPGLLAWWSTLRDGVVYTAKDTGTITLDKLAYLAKSDAGVPLYPLASSGSFSRAEMEEVLSKLRPKTQGGIWAQYGFFKSHYMAFIVRQDGVTIIDPQIGQVFRQFSDINLRYTSFRYFTTVRAV